MSDGRPTHLDLFSGIGGFALAARWAGFRTIGFCEIDKYCQRVLTKNFLACGNKPELFPKREGITQRSHQGEEGRSQPVFCGDIRQLDGKQFTGVSLITGGFPCQPFSCAGKRRGKADDRHLWPEMLRVITEARPAWVLGENVAGIIGMELDAVLSDLEAIGYATRPFVIPACGVDARHRRNRVWIVANRSSERMERNGASGEQEPHSHAGSEISLRESGDVADASKERLEQYSERDGKSNRGEQSSCRNDAGRCGEDVSDAKKVQCRQEHPNAGGTSERARAPKERTGLEHGFRWQPEPDVGRVAHGIPSRVDRLKGLGNAIVPQVAFQILKAIREQIENETLQTPDPD